MSLPYGQDPNAPAHSTALNSDCPCASGKMLVFTQSYVKGKRIFRPQEQYCFKERFTKRELCNCGTKGFKDRVYYRIIIAGKVFDVLQDFVAETHIQLEKGEFGQDFHARLSNMNGMAPGQQYDLPPDRSKENLAAFNRVIM